VQNRRFTLKFSTLAPILRDHIDRRVSRAALSASGSTHGVVRGQSRGKEVSHMRKYELVCIIQPELDESALNGVIDKVRGWIGEAGGNVDKVDVWGKRQMAYRIRKQREGQYFLLNVSLPPQANSELERNLRLTEPVLRYMFTLID
jgi:small subunit ribosomal protein S6